MANLLQSSTTSASTAPGFYTDYLSNLASSGQAAQQGAQYVGAQPLQEQAFTQAGTTANQFQPSIAAGQGIVNRAANTDITGAADPYLQAGTSASPLSAAQPLINEAAGMNLGDVASQYMSPFLNSSVQQLSDIGQRNIINNLSPAATAAAVGSGQFGSQRGAQVLGQVNEQAQQDINSQIASLENSGYASALQAAQAKEAALGNLANTTSSAQQAQNQANLTAGQTASGAAANEAGALNTAGTGMGTLGTAGNAMNLADINALSTLGGQQQTIEQNKELFPLSTLSSLSSLLQGYNMPMTTTQTMNMSPLSAAAAISGGVLGMTQPGANGTPSQYDNLMKTLGFGGSSSTSDQAAINAQNAADISSAGINDTASNNMWATSPDITASDQTLNPFGIKRGGRVQHHGALPRG